ncbi:MAG: T9SS type A sorting domain-containing protein [Flavobacteriales bacterium]
MRNFQHLLRAMFTLVLIAPLVCRSQTINSYRYWFDDNATGAITVAVPVVQDLTLNANIDASMLGKGYHLATLQFKDNNQRWGAPVTRTFVITAADLIAREYWFDDDVSTLQTVSVSATQVLNVTTLIDASLLGDGPHTITLRSTDAIGNWSVPLTQAFDVTVGITEVPGLESVVLMPNPVDEQLQLRFDARTAIDLTYDVIDASGRSVRGLERVIISASALRTIDASNFAPGVYQLRLIGRNGVKCMPFIKR